MQRNLDQLHRKYQDLSIRKHKHRSDELESLQSELRDEIFYYKCIKPGRMPIPAPNQINFNESYNPQLVDDGAYF